MKKIKVKLTFVEPVLGTWPSNQNIAREFIASKSPDAATVEDEVAALGADAGWDCTAYLWVLDIPNGMVLLNKDTGKTIVFGK